MGYSVKAACGCNTGKIRKNNEDNFYFDGKCLEQENNGLRNPAYIETTYKNGLCFAVFDGMGGENFGEIASYAAAREMQKTERSFSDFLMPERKYLERMVFRLNDAVVREQRNMCTEHMGSTMVCIYFSGKRVYVCNVGDSRAYRLRDGEFLQLSHDHIELRPGKDRKKAPLTQHLGFDSDEIQIEPYIAKGDIKKDDIYLLCSDGLTDMLTNFDISSILINNSEMEECVQSLISKALENGGHDNITVIAVKII